MVTQREKISVYSISNYLSHLVRKSDKSIAETWNYRVILGAKTQMDHMT